jgi:hypothetical protein
MDAAEAVNSDYDKVIQGHYTSYASGTRFKKWNEFTGMTTLKASRWAAHKVRG